MTSPIHATVQWFGFDRTKCLENQQAMPGLWYSLTSSWPPNNRVTSSIKETEPQVYPRQNSNQGPNLRELADKDRSLNVVSFHEKKQKCLQWWPRYRGEKCKSWIIWRLHKVYFPQSTSVLPVTKPNFPQVIWPWKSEIHKKQSMSGLGLTQMDHLN